MLVRLDRRVGRSATVTRPSPSRFRSRLAVSSGCRSGPAKSGRAISSDVGAAPGRSGWTAVSTHRGTLGERAERTGPSGSGGRRRAGDGGPCARYLPGVRAQVDEGTRWSASPCRGARPRSARCPGGAAGDARRHGGPRRRPARGAREALHDLERHSTGERLPGLLESPGMSVDRLRAFASAAAAFFAARPWDHLANEDLLIAEGGRAPRNLRHLCVLGQGGHQFGLAFFDSRAAFERLLEGTGAGRAASRAHG